MLYLAYALLTLHTVVGIFLIGLILLQRGRGGGLAGAFGGMGGQSAFGTKAGDIFTRITIVVAVIWILLACVCILVVNAAMKPGRFKPAAVDAVIKAPANDGDASGTDKSGKEVDGKAKSSVPPSPDKSETTPEQPKGDEKKSDAADDTKPAEANAKPATEAPDAAKDKDTGKPAIPETTDAKKPE